MHVQVRLGDVGAFFCLLHGGWADFIQGQVGSSGMYVWVELGCTGCGCQAVVHAALLWLEAPPWADSLSF